MATRITASAAQPCRRRAEITLTHILRILIHTRWQREHQEHRPPQQASKPPLVDFRSAGVLGADSLHLAPLPA
jgi:hypothetical protein